MPLDIDCRRNLAILEASSMTQPREVMVGVDLGGTSLRALAVDSGNKILAVEKTPTRRGEKPGELIAEIAAMVVSAVESAGLKRGDLRAVSVGAPGAVDPARGIVHHAPNLGWEEVPLGRKLKARLGVPVLVENDVNVGVVGEHVLGAGKGAQDLLGIFVGTGIGGGIVIDGQLYEGSRAGAGEVGHVVVQVDGPRCGCGKRGCIEALASRTAMEREVRAAVRAGETSIVPKLMKKRGKQRMTSSIIEAALKKQDAVMRKVLRRAQRYLGIFVGSMVNVLDPEVVVIGGGIAERLQQDFVGPIRETAYKYFLHHCHAERVRIVPGILGDNAGALGAVVLARQRLDRAR
jgi:glucokinase